MLKSAAAVMAGAALLAFSPAPEPDWENHPANVWVGQSPRPGKPAPAFGWEGSGAYDPFTRRWIHHGGHDGVPQGFHLFTFDPATGAWEQRFPNTSPPGVCCVDGAQVFDPANRRFVRFPGASLGHGYQWSRGVKLRDSHVWLYDPAANSWTAMRPPPYRPFLNREGLGRLNASATFDPNHEVSLTFGGQDNGGGTNNLFAYDAYANRLTRLPAAGPPSRRDGVGLTYDARHDCLVLFGSRYDSDEKTWLYRYATGKWEAHALDPHPPGKKRGTYATIPRLAYDSRNGICLCVTRDSHTGRHETWAFDAGKLRWSKLNPPAEPAPSMSRSRNLDYDAEHNVFLLETSAQEGKGRAPEIWTYRYRKAAPDPRPAPPAELRVLTEPGKATLTWAAGAAPVRGYNVYRARGEEPWQNRYDNIATVPGTTFADANLAAGKVTFYRVTAVGQDGAEGRLSFSARTQPRVLPPPVVSVLAADRVEVRWQKHPAADVAGYNLYRGTAEMRSVQKGTPKAWSDNDPEYAEPLPVEVRDITGLRKLNDRPLSATTFTDAQVNLTAAERDEKAYRHAVFAYVVKSVNRLGTESGPSPYALTIPSSPMNVLCRERGDTAELKWDANPEQGIAGYHVYKLGKGVWDIVRVTPAPVKEASFRHLGGRGTTRYWVVAVDALGQEGEPSSPVWHHRSYKGFFPGEWHQ
jgi:fibronectin type 3 domain-containing protein